MPKISIIVPIYKVEQYIHNCINSILSQTFTDFEVILVDDGSPDHCGNICDQYALNNNCIKVIHKSNGGISSARNAGLDAACGDYIAFVDGDDYIDQNMYSILFSYAQSTDADVLYCEATFIHSDGTSSADDIPLLYEDTELTKKNWTPEILKYTAGGVHHAMYKATLLKENRIRFIEGLPFSEDRIFNLYAMGYANKTFFIKRSLYNIVLHDDSCTQSFHKNHFQAAKRIAAETEKALMLAWNNNLAFQNSYLTQFVTNGINAIKGLNHKDCPYRLSEKYDIICDICSDDQLQEAILVTNYKSDYAVLISKKKCLFILLITMNRCIRIGYRIFRKVQSIGSKM